MQFSRRRHDRQPGAQLAPGHATWPQAPTGPTEAPYPTGQVRPPSDPIRHKLAEALPLATIPMPHDVSTDHEPVIVYAAGFKPVAELGDDPGTLLTIVLEELGRSASEGGCDAVWDVRNTLAVDNGVMYITAMGTGSRPTLDPDGPPGAHPTAN